MSATLRQKIHECLAAASGVTDLLGTGDALRHYAEQAPEGVAAPYVVSSEIAGLAATSHGTTGDAEDNLDETDLQFTALAATAAEALAVRQAVRIALVGDGGGILAAAGIKATAPRTRFNSADELNLHGAQLDLTFFHNPTT